MQLDMLYKCIFLMVIIRVVDVRTDFFDEPLPLTIENPCVTKTTCHNCIQTPSCAWCKDPDMNYTSRCFEPSSPSTTTQQCPERYVYNPDNEKETISSLPLTKPRSHGFVSSASSSTVDAEANSIYDESRYSAEEEESFYGHEAHEQFDEEIITQISPQRLRIKLRTKEQIQMFYTQAKDYPVDLYYLMDLSQSMADDKKKLSMLGNLLSETLKNITTDATLGFGSFVDKVVMPYVDTMPQNLQEPCNGCAAPYSFKNTMRLSKNTYEFSHMVENASISGNLDGPEGGLDAMMQAIVCQGEIGWREKARRLLVVSTDAVFHYAGDGKLGGIVKPNDGMCHLDSAGYYTMSSYQDYPSVSQINLHVKQNSINVIFAVTAETTFIYKDLITYVEGATCGTLSNDSSNIIELITEQYAAISSTVEMKHNASTQWVNVRFHSRCLNADGPLLETNKCDNLKVGSVVEFKIELELVKCPADPHDWLQTIVIYPVGLNESLCIDLELLCSCPCEHPGDDMYEELSPLCRNRGTYKCGVCECDAHSFGRSCECQANEMYHQNQSADCISPLNSLQCSGRGDCVCGTCVCAIRNVKNEDQRIYGKYCECDNLSCERHNGQLCSGPEHGSCDCGRCVCQSGWTGENCACLASVAPCYAPGNVDGKPCSGNGVCECGLCKCNSTEKGRFSGKFCEQCPTCADRCEEFKHCVQCQMYKTGPLSEKDCEACVFTPISVDAVEMNEDNNENLCAYYDEDDCRFTYVYYFDEDKAIAVRAQRERECPPKVFLMGIVLGVIAAVVLMGLAVLLLWKLLTTIHDRREFARFEKERMMAKWDTGENPIYKQATSTFKNPMYAGKC